jgi:hypothetical protein
MVGTSRFALYQCGIFADCLFSGLFLGRAS